MLCKRASVAEWMADPNSAFGGSTLASENPKTLAKNNKEGRNEFIVYFHIFNLKLENVTNCFIGLNTFWADTKNTDMSNTVGTKDREEDKVLEAREENGNHSIFSFCFSQNRIDIPKISNQDIPNAFPRYPQDVPKLYPSYNPDITKTPKVSNIYPPDWKLENRAGSANFSFFTFSRTKICHHTDLLTSNLGFGFELHVV